MLPHIELIEIPNTLLVVLVLLELLVVGSLEILLSLEFKRFELVFFCVVDLKFVVSNTLFFMN